MMNRPTTRLPLRTSVLASAVVAVVSVALAAVATTVILHRGDVETSASGAADRTGPATPPVASSIASGPGATAGRTSTDMVADGHERVAAESNVPKPVNDRLSAELQPRHTVPIDGPTLVALLPPSLIELARSTVWDDEATALLERLLVSAFDADGDGVLDDLERIRAVQAMRDAMWPDGANGNTSGGDAQGSVAPGVGDGPPLSLEDLRLHHDVDEARRLDGSPNGESVVDPALRETIIASFRLDDDGVLSLDEFARFMRHYRADSGLADLNGDGRVDEIDLRIFLDIASPIESPSESE